MKSIFFITASSLLLLLLTTENVTANHHSSSKIIKSRNAVTQEPQNYRHDSPPTIHKHKKKTSPISSTLSSIPNGGSSTPPPAATTTKRKLKSMDLAIAGAIATMIGDASMHPIDCIKTLQQSNAGAGLNMISASKQIWKESGIGGFYFGMGTYVTTDGCAGALKFATYEALKVWFDDKIPEEKMPYALFGFAAISFIASSVILVPGELIKQRLQVGQISSVSSGIQSIWKNEGIMGFFTGYSAVCLRDVPYTMLELGIYDNLKSLYLKLKNRNNGGETQQQITQMDEIVAAAITGGIAGYLTNPLDTIKTKLMLQASDAQLYSGFMDCGRQIIQANGVGSLFQGAAARVAWLVPFTAIYLPIYEIIKRKLETTKVNEAGVSDTALKVKGGGMDGHGPFLREQQQQKDGARWFHPAVGTTARKYSRAITSTRRNRLDLDECFVSF